MNLMVIFVGITTLIYVILTFLVLKRRKREKMHNRFLLFLIVGCLWVGIGMLEVSTLQYNKDINLVLSKFDFILAAFIAYFVVTFSIHFPSRNKQWTLIKEITLLVPIIVISIFIWLEKVFFYIENSLTYSISWYLIYYSVIVIYFLIITSVNFIKKYKASIGIQKAQLKYIIGGYYFSVVAGLVMSAYFAFNNSATQTQIFGLANIGTTVFATMCFYAIVKYRFMDIKVVIRKGVIYGVSLIIALAIYTYFALALKSTIEESWDVNPTWIAAILIALVALGFPPLKKLVEKGVDKLFKGKKSIDLAVKEVREKLSRKTNIQELVSMLATEIKNYLSVQEAKVFILNKKEEAFTYHPDEYIHELLKTGKSDIVTLIKERKDITVQDEVPHLLEEGKGNGWLEKGAKEMKKRNVNVVAPLYVDNELFGLITLAEKKDKGAFTVQDIQYLERIRDQVAPTIANAILYQDAMERIGAVESV